MSGSSTSSVRLTKLDSFASDGNSYVAVVKDGGYAYAVDNLAKNLLVLDVTGDALVQVSVLGMQDQVGDEAITSVVKSGDHLYIAAGRAGLIVADVSMPAAPVVTAQINTHGLAMSAFIKGKRLFLCDASAYRVFSLANPGTPVEVGVYEFPASANYASVLTDSVVVGDFAYLVSPGNLGNPFLPNYGGFIFLDISSSNPRVIQEEIGPTNYYTLSVAAYGDFMLAGIMGNGLWIFDSRKPWDVSLTAVLLTGDSAGDEDQVAYKIIVQGHYAFIADGYNGISVVDLQNIFNPKLIYRVETGGKVTGISVNGDFLVAVDDTTGVHLFRIDEFPAVLDTDGDVIPDMNDLDDDGDSRTDATDIHPLDTDNDGIDNVVDPDDDNDSYLDAADAFPLDEEEWADLNYDGIGDNFPNNRFAVMVTNYGEIRLELFEDLAPLTTKNFIRLAQDGIYDGVIFHRVIAGFMDQSGDPNGDGTGGPGYKIIDEYSKDASGNLLLQFDQSGILAMANTGASNSGGSQFFITVDDYQDGDGHYAIFGRVVEGLDVVQAINAVPTVNNKPVDDVVMESVTITTD